MPGVSFSVKYKNPDDPDRILAADWDWQKKRSWTISSSALEGRILWEMEKWGIDELAKMAILKKFGLEDYEKEFPVELIENLSPAALIGMRRQIERECNLQKLEVATESMHIIAGIGQINYTAEEYT